MLRILVGNKQWLRLNLYVCDYTEYAFNVNICSHNANQQVKKN